MNSKNKAALLLLVIGLVCTLCFPIAAYANSIDQHKNIIIISGAEVQRLNNSYTAVNIPEFRSLLNSSLASGLIDNSKLNQALKSHLQEFRLEVLRFVEDLNKAISGIKIEAKQTLPKDIQYSEIIILKPSEKTLPEKQLDTKNNFSGYDLKAEELSLLQLTNAFRIENGLQELVLTPELAAMAKSHCDDMSQNNYLDHRLFESRLANFVTYNFSTAAENISSGYHNAQTTHEAWLNSPGHRNNILTGSFKKIGIGSSISNEGVPYWCQVFTD